MRIFFSTDVHGATLVWRKWITAVSMYGADTLILSGDLTGKVLVPIVKQEDGSYKSTYFGTSWTFKTEEEIADFERRLEDGGAYSIVCDKAKLEELKNSPEEVSKVMKEKMVERIRAWLDLLVERIDTKKVLTVVMPGNDDEFVIDPVIKEFEGKGIVYPLDKVITLDGHELLSFEYVNPTPWDTPRELDERGLKEKIEEKISFLKNPHNAIFNFHCPPSDTKIDIAPKLDRNMRLVGGLDGVKLVHVGSKSVRSAIEKYRPFLGLHGHIHESSGFDRVSDTLVINPGSEYGEGTLRGYIIELEEGSLKNYWKIQG